MPGTASQGTACRTRLYCLRIKRLEDAPGKRENHVGDDDSLLSWRPKLLLLPPEAVRPWLAILPRLVSNRLRENQFDSH